MVKVSLLLYPQAPLTLAVGYLDWQVFEDLKISQEVSD